MEAATSDMANIQIHAQLFFKLFVSSQLLLFLENNPLSFEAKCGPKEIESDEICNS